MKRILRSLAVVVLSTVTTLHGFAADSLSADASLEQTLAHAARHNAAVQAAEHRWRAAIEKVPQARGWPDPRLSYGYFLENVETRVGPQEHRIGVMQPLPWFGKLKAAGDVAGAEAAAALAELTATQLRVAREVKDAWFELAWLAEARRITRDNVELVRQLEAVAQTQFSAGGTLAGVTKAQVELGKLQDRVASFDDRVTPGRARLNALLNRDFDAPLPEPSLAVVRGHELPEVRELFAWQREANPLLEALTHRIEREQHAVRLARKQGRPEFGLGVDYVVTGEARMPGVADSGKDAVIAMFNVTIPLWRGKYKAAEAEAEARRDEAEAARQGRLNELEAALSTALFQHRDAERKINLYGATLLPQARGALNVARQGYETGNGGFLDLIDSQRVLLEFELEHQRALADREQALAAIEMLIGRELGGPAVAAPVDSNDPNH